MRHRHGRPAHRAAPPRTAPARAAGPGREPASARPWAEDDQQGVRPYVITGGRTQPHHPMRMESILEVTAQATAVGPMGPEAAQAVTLCRIQPRPVAEIAAVLGLPVTITKIILSDLMQRGVLTPAVPRTTTGRLDKEQALEALLAGLRSMSDVA